MKFAKTFLGVKAGEIYPTEFKPGEDCPDELLSAAQACNVLEPDEGTNPDKSKGKKAEG